MLLLLHAFIHTPALLHDPTQSIFKIKMPPSLSQPLFLILLLLSLSLPSFAADHLAHAVPGESSVHYDLDGSGSEAVTLDGSLSHSHFFSAGPPVVNGVVESYAWRNWGATGGKILCRSEQCKLDLGTGEHWIDLTVTDNAGNVATAGVEVVVKSGASARSAGTPVVKDVEPASGGTGGGMKFTVRGSGFLKGSVVRFGESEAMEVDVVDERTIYGLTPAHGAGEGSVVVENENGVSGGGTHFLFEDEDIAIAWEEGVWMNKYGSEWNEAEEVSGIAVGPDGAYYLSTLVGLVWRVEVGADLVVKSACSGAQMGPGRAIYSIAWNAADPKPRMLVTTNIMWYRDAGSVWHSSQVEFVNIEKKSGCVSKGGVLISGLPMSNLDHGVLAMSFLDDGTLLVSVGAATNAGVPGKKMGGTMESPLSGSVVQAKYLVPGFDGAIKYSLYKEGELGRTKVVSGDVSVYAAGFRSCFGLERSTAGVVYATENGANIGFGPKSTSCSASGGMGNVKDSLYLLEAGNYYGHANRNRGRKDKRQCVWRGKGTTAAIAEMESSTNGLLSYTGDAFGGQMRNDLFLTKLAWFGQRGRTLRVELSKDGRSVVKGPYEIWGDSGLSIVQGPSGELFMPQLKKKRVMVLVPKKKKGATGGVARLFLFGSTPEVHTVHPNRGNIAGGTNILVTGARFSAGLSVKVSGTSCTDLRILSTWLLRCKVPASQRRGAVDVIVIGTTGSSFSVEPNFVYAGGV